MTFRNFVTRSVFLLCFLLENKEINSGIYNLQGVFLGHDVKNLAPGIYIINGKKQTIR